MKMQWLSAFTVLYPSKVLKTQQLVNTALAHGRRRWTPDLRKDPSGWHRPLHLHGRAGPKFWHKSAVTDGKGRFAFNGLAPSGYALRAWQQLPDDFGDPALFPSFMSKGADANVSERSGLQVTLQMNGGEESGEVRESPCEVRAISLLACANAPDGAMSRRAVHQSGLLHRQMQDELSSGSVGGLDRDRAAVSLHVAAYQA